MSTLLYELDADSIYEEITENFDEVHDVEDDDDYREDRMEQMISRHGWRRVMQTIISEELTKHDDLEAFAEYLGIDYEDFYEMLVLENVYEYDYDDLS